MRRAAGTLLLLTLSAGTAAQPEVAPPPRPKVSLPDGAVARVGHPRLRVPMAVITVAFAPPGRTFVSTAFSTATPDESRFVALWDADTGKEIRRFQGHTGAGVNAAAFAADGKLLATGGADGTVRIWDVATGAERKKLSGHTDAVLAVAYSPNGKLVASVGHDAWVRVWDADAGQELRRLPSAKSQGTSNLQFSPDGKHLAAVGTGGKVRLWNPDTGADVGILSGPTGDTLSLDFSPDGERLAGIGTDGRVRVWSPARGTGPTAFPAHAGTGTCVRFSPGGKALATGGSDGRIRFWDTTGKPLREAAGHPGNVSEISFSRDGTVLASAGHEGTVRLWDVATGRELPQSGGTAARVALSPDGKRIATASNDPAVRFWNAATGAEVTPALKLDRPAGALGFLPDGTLVTADSPDELRFWDTTAGKLVRQFSSRTNTPITRMAVGPGGRFVATAGGVAPAATARLWDVPASGPAAAAARFTTAVGRYPPLWAMVFAPGDRRLAVSGGDGRVHVWDATGWEESFPVSDPGGGAALAVAWSADGNSLATATPNDRMLRVWEAATGRERRAAIHLPATTRAVAFSPDGRVLAAGDDGGAVHAIDVRTGKFLATRPGHAGPVTFLAFTPDGRFLVSASPDVPAVAPLPADAPLTGDGAAVVWDTAALTKGLTPAPKPAAGDAAALWAALKGPDAAKAFDAVCRLAAAPDLAVPFLREHLPATDGRVGKQVEKFLADLDHDEFEVREEATRELIALGPAAARAVAEAAAESKSREVRRRAEEVVAQVGRVAAANPDEIVIGRGVEVLRRVGTPEARAVLKAWAAGPATSMLAREARAALPPAAKVP